MRLIYFLIASGLIFNPGCKTKLETKNPQEQFEGSEISAVRTDSGEGKNNSRDIRKGDTLYALQKMNNDFSTDLRDPIGNNIIPLSLSNFIKSNIKEGDSIQNIYLVQYSDSISIFFVRIGSSILSSLFGYRVYAYDYSTNLFTHSPPYIYGRWMENDEEGFSPKSKLVEQPYSNFEDITGDDRKEIVIQERIHNGTSINSVEKKYFELDQQMELKLILVMEAKALMPFNDCIINRKLNQKAIDVFLSCEGQEEKKIGTISLSFSGQVFEINDLVFFTSNKDLQTRLVTITGKKDQLYIKQGYNFYY